MIAPSPRIQSAAAQAMRTQDLARRWQCSERTVRNLIATGALPAFRLGGKLLRIPQSAVESFEQCQTNGSSALGESSRLHGTKADAAFVTRSALIAARKQTNASPVS
jgi:excisionase family DNA binding protein